MKNLGVVGGLAKNAGNYAVFHKNRLALLEALGKARGISMIVEQKSLAVLTVLRKDRNFLVQRNA